MFTALEVHFSTRIRASSSTIVAEASIRDIFLANFQSLVIQQHGRGAGGHRVVFEAVHTGSSRFRNADREMTTIGTLTAIVSIREVHTQSVFGW